MKYLLIILLLVSCSVEKQAQKKTAWLIAHDKLDDVCARIYPVKDSLVVRNSVSFDTLYVENEVFIRDTVTREGRTVYIEKKCPPHQVITKVVNRDSIIYRTNTAEVERLKGEVLSKEKQIKEKDNTIIGKDKKIDKNDWWKWACLITWFAIVLGGVFRFFVIKRPI
jgi:hypothetical protein